MYLWSIRTRKRTCVHVFLSCALFSQSHVPIIFRIHNFVQKYYKRECVCVCVRACVGAYVCIYNTRRRRIIILLFCYCESGRCRDVRFFPVFIVPLCYAGAIIMVPLCRTAHPANPSCFVSLATEGSPSPERQTPRHRAPRIPGHRRWYSTSPGAHVWICPNLFKDVWC